MTNPLRDPQDRRLPKIAGPCSLVIFGVTGDLSRKKVMPAIYDLANRGLLPPGFSLVGFARRDWADQDFAQIVHDAVAEYARTPFREDVWAALRVAQADGFVAALPRALDTVDISTGEKAVAINQRSDVCAVPAAGVVAEAPGDAIMPR